MRRYRLATYAVLATLPFTVLAGCQSGNSGSPAPAPGGAGATTASAPAGTSAPSDGSDGSGGSNGSFCQQFAKTQTDLVTAAQNGTLSASDAEAEVNQTLDAAPSDVVQPVTVILNVRYDILTKDPNGQQERLSPTYSQSEQAYLAWSKTNC
ncbi:MAG TPA: hypothetical protein VH333_00315 [Pseudonocardiaceae bacterium]|jgi:hypothetical protein|nr:hypothetical protein [Pseudonocardiaceae bacterium]